MNQLINQLKGNNVMKRVISKEWFIVVLVLAFASGCASYYRVTDVQSGKEYYTKDIDTARNGAVKLKDARSGSVVTLQSSEVKEISSKEYEAGLAAPLSKPTPTPAAVPAPTPAQETGPPPSGTK